MAAVSRSNPRGNALVLAASSVAFLDSRDAILSALAFSRVALAVSLIAAASFKCSSRISRETLPIKYNAGSNCFLMVAPNKITAPSNIPLLLNIEASGPTIVFITDKESRIRSLNAAASLSKGLADTCSDNPPNFSSPSAITAFNIACLFSKEVNALALLFFSRAYLD